MNVTIVQRWLWLWVLLALAALIVAVAFLSRSSDDREIVLVGIPKSNFDGSTGREVISAPPFLAIPKLSADDAVAAAREEHPVYGQEGVVRQVALVWLTNTATDPPEKRLAWVVNFDPATVPVGYVHCQANPCPKYESAGALVFVDAQSGDIIFGWETAREVPSPSPPGIASIPRLFVTSIDGPRAIVVPWRGADPVTVECGEGGVNFGPEDGPSGPWDVVVTNAETGETMFEGPVSGEFYIAIRRDFVITGDEPSSGGPVPGFTCPPSP